MKTILSLLTSLLTVTCLFGSCSRRPNLEVFDSWQSGKIVSADQVEQYGLVRCFRSEPIDDEVFGRMYGKSYKEDCTVQRDELRYLKVLHIDFEGRITMGELVCNKLIDQKLLEIFKVLYLNRYPIERIALIDDFDASDDRSMEADNSSAFNFRTIAGTTRLSNHSTGLAVDINPLYNPYVKVLSDGSEYVSPESGRKYADRSCGCPYMILADDLCCTEFLKRGFEWGGNWTSLKDYQHFEYPVAQ